MILLKWIRGYAKSTEKFQSSEEWRCQAAKVPGWEGEGNWGCFETFSDDIGIQMLLIGHRP